MNTGTSAAREAANDRHFAIIPAMFAGVPGLNRPDIMQLRSASAAVLLLVVLLVVLYPLAVTALAHPPGLRGGADGSLTHADGRVVGPALLGQNFTGANGDPLPHYFQPRPSATGYDPTASSASNLGPESIVDVLPAGGQGRHRSTPLLHRHRVGAVLAVLYRGPGYHGRTPGW